MRSDSGVRQFPGNRDISACHSNPRASPPPCPSPYFTAGKTRVAAITSDHDTIARCPHRATTSLRKRSDSARSRRSTALAIEKPSAASGDLARRVLGNNRAQCLRTQAIPLRHGDGELGAGPAILRPRCHNLRGVAPVQQSLSIPRRPEDLRRTAPAYKMRRSQMRVRSHASPTTLR
jgi:hypothetical protein